MILFLITFDHRERDVSLSNERTGTNRQLILCSKTISTETSNIN